MDIDVSIVNLTDKTFDIDNVSIQFPESLIAVRENFSAVVTDEVDSIGGSAELIYSKRLPRAKLPLWESIIDTETLFFTPGTYQLRAEAEVKLAGADSVVRRIYATTEIVLEAPLSASIRGGVIGALLLALFVPSYRAVRASGQKRRIVDVAKQAMVYLVAGSVVSTTAILVVYRLGSVSLPISITVNDYLGGIIVGLFSYVIGDALYAQFFGKESG